MEIGSFQELLDAGLDFAALIQKFGGDQNRATIDDTAPSTPRDRAASTDAPSTPRDRAASTDAPSTPRDRAASTDAPSTPRDRAASTDAPSTPRDRAASTDAPSTPRERAASTDAGAAKRAPRQLMEKEERNKGAVKLQVYKAYFVASGGLASFMGVFMWFVVAQVRRAHMRARMHCSQEPTTSRLSLNLLTLDVVPAR